MTPESIFSIKNNAQFEQIALEVFRYQAKACAPYKRYIEELGLEPNQTFKIEQIPFMPIALFKHFRVSTLATDDIVFTSSGTSSSTVSRHYIADVSLYEKSFTHSFEQFYGNPSQCNIYALLPSYLERNGSSLIYMVENLISKSYDGGFFLYNHDALIDRLEKRDKTKKTILFGVSFALLDLIEEHSINLADQVVVMETGGMKGRREELTRQELHQRLCQGLGVSAIHSEYGMCELLSQAYSNGNGIFCSPNHMRIISRSITNPSKHLPHGVRGAINIIDLANLYSCSFIQTEDIGKTLSSNTFTIDGRLDKSEIRGCNLLLSKE